MAQIHFTQQLGRFMRVPQVESDARRLRAALEAAFAAQPRLRAYVLDDQGRLRPNVVIFIDGVRSRDRVLLDDPLGADSRVYVLQALSGG
ncbi:MAG: MoaD/ThiS family protein [Pseudomonadota bacterium]